MMGNLENGPPCPTCGEAMDGIMLWDGYDPLTMRATHGHTVFCIPCRDVEAAKERPWRDDPRLKRLRQTRIECAISLHEMAAITGMTPADYSALERGATEPPAYTTLSDWEYVMRAGGPVVRRLDPAL